MKCVGRFVMVAFCSGVIAGAQSTTPPFPVELEKDLAARASTYTEVSLDKKMLSFASKFMDGKDQDAEAKRVIEKLQGIYVREYEFDKPGKYTTADLQRIRNQVAGSDWSPMVRERSKNGEDDTDVYVRLVNGQILGMFIVDAEKNQLDLVYIAGPVDPAEIVKLGGTLGIPKHLPSQVGKGSK